MDEKRLSNVALMRWIAALFVMTGHIYCLFQYTPPIFLWNAVHTIGIKSFFVLGGVLVTGSWAREKNIRNYLIKRVTRIFPPLLVYVFVVAVIIGPILSTLSTKDYYSNPLFWKYLLNGLLYINYALPGVFESNPYPVAVNGSLWSLPIEVLMYILVPIFYNISKKSQKSCYICVFLVCLACVLKKAFFPEWYYVIYGMDVGSILDVVPYYFMGMLLYVVAEKTNIFSMIKIETAVFLIAFSYIYPGNNEIIILLMSLICIPYVVMGIANSTPNVYMRFLSRHEITYGIYLYGFFVQQCVIYAVNKYGWELSLCTIEVLAIVITIFISELSYQFIEKPIMKWSKKIMNKR